jgi:hypothetical protein
MVTRSPTLNRKGSGRGVGGSPLGSTCISGGMSVRILGLHGVIHGPRVQTFPLRSIATSVSPSPPRWPRWIPTPWPPRPRMSRYVPVGSGIEIDSGDRQREYGLEDPDRHCCRATGHDPPTGSLFHWAWSKMSRV